LIEIGSKTAEKNSAQTNKQTNRHTNRHYENNGHLAVNQQKNCEQNSNRWNSFVLQNKSISKFLEVSRR